MHSQLETRSNGRLAIRPASDPMRLLQQMFVEQVSSAIRLISKPHTDGTRVHEARQHLKRARATLRLLRSGLRSSSFRRADRTLRDAAQLLSAARDADVLIRLLDTLTLQPKASDAERPLGALRERLLKRYELAQTNFATPRAAAIALLRDAVNQSRAWMPSGAGRNAIVAELVRTYTKSRKAYRAILSDVDDERLHAWRKQVKYSRYQLESLAGLTPPRMNKRAQHLEKLGHILGEDHDLALLRAEARRMARSIPNLRPRSIDALVGHRRLKLQADAFAMGASLYKRRPRQFAKKLL